MKAIARREGVSMAEVIRWGVDRVLDDDAPTRDALYEAAFALIGKFQDRDGATDVAERHDDVILRTGPPRNPIDTSGVPLGLSLGTGRRREANCRPSTCAIG